MVLDTYRARTVAIQEALMNGGALLPLSYFDTRRYIQHNLLLEDGVGAILAFVDGLPKDRTSARVRRSFEDGEFSVAHADYALGDWGEMVGFEVHRWDGGRIVEHWDNLQPAPASPNRAGRSMTDGAGEHRENGDQTENKDLVERFTRTVLIARDIHALPGFFPGGSLIQHSPDLPDEADAWGAKVAGGGVRYDRMHRILGGGGLVLTICEGVIQDGCASSPVSFYDLYRVEASVIAEHWDVVERIPPWETWRNSNGKF